MIIGFHARIFAILSLIPNRRAQRDPENSLKHCVVADGDRKELVMKKFICSLAVIISVILLFPLRGQMKDGGSVEYRAILYRVVDVHRISEDPEKEFDEGIIVEIFGFEVFNNVE